MIFVNGELFKFPTFQLFKIEMKIIKNKNSFAATKNIKSVQECRLITCLKCLAKIYLKDFFQGYLIKSSKTANTAQLQLRKETADRSQ